MEDKSHEEPPSYSVRLLAGKARVTSVRGSTAPGLELNGLLILSHLLKMVLQAMWEKPDTSQIDGRFVS